MMESTNSTLTLKRDPLHQQHHLKEAVSIAVKEECDLFIVSRDKKVFPCQRSLLVLYSPLISRILSDLPCCSGESPTIFLPFQEQHIKKLLLLLGSGQAIFDQNINNDMKIVAKIAKVLQISMTDIKIGTYLDNPLGVPGQIKKELDNSSVKVEIKEEVEKINVKQETKRLSGKDDEQYDEPGQCDEPEYIEEDESEKPTSDNLKKEEVSTANSKVSSVMETNILTLNSGSSTTDETVTILENREETEGLGVLNPVEPRDTSNDGDVEEQELQSRQNCDGLAFITSVTSLSYPQKSVSSSVMEPNSGSSTTEETGNISDNREETEDLVVQNPMELRDTSNDGDVDEQEVQSNQNCDGLGVITSVTSLSYRKKSISFSVREGSLAKPTQHSKLGDLHVKDTVRRKKRGAGTPIGFYFEGEKNEALQLYGKGEKFIKSAGSAAKDEAGLKDHMKIQTGEKRHVCSYCQKGFTKPSHLKRHTRSHTGEKPFQCQYCPQKFTCSGDLKRHTRTHTGEKPFQCQFCSKKFSQASHLKDHTRIHTGEKPFQCESCPQKFTKHSHLNQHTMTHTGEKPFQCEFCSKTFTKRNNLNRHTSIHTGEKPKTRKLEDLEEEIAVSRKKRVKVGEAVSDKKKKDKKKEEEAEVKEEEMDVSIQTEGDATTSKKKKAKEEAEAAETTMDTNAVV